MSDGLLFYLATGVSLLLIGLSKGGVGGMLGPLVTATMALVLPADQAIGLLLPLLIVGDAFAIAAHWRHWSGLHARRLVPASILGVILAMVLLTDLPPLILRRGIGLIILLFILFRWLEPRLRRDAKLVVRPWHGHLAGASAGFTSSLAHVGGPPISIYLLVNELPPPVYAATSALFFAVLNLIKLPFYILAGLLMPDLLWRTLPLLPLLPLGVWLGKAFAHRMPLATFNRLILGLLLLSAASLLLGA